MVSTLANTGPLYVFDSDPDCEYKTLQAHPLGHMFNCKMHTEIL